MSDALYIGAIVVFLLLMVVAAILDLRRPEEEEKKMIERLDKHMEMKDDDNWPANFVP